MSDQFACVNAHKYANVVNACTRICAITNCCLSETVDEDIDGVPMDDDDNASARNKEDEKKSSMPAGFVPSRWETVDPDQVQKYLRRITSVILSSRK